MDRKTHVNMNTVKGIEPMVFGMVNWTEEEIRNREYLMSAPIEFKEREGYFHRTEEMRQQIKNSNLFWECGNPWGMYYCIPSTRELLPVACPLLLATYGGKPMVC